MDNKENKNTRKNKIIKVTALLGLFLLVFGISYALFSVVLEGTKRNKIITGNLDVFIGDKEGIKENEEVLAINLDNEFPITDEEGKEKTSYEFTLVNNGSIDADYTIKLINNDISNEENRLQDKYVKYMLIRDGIEEVGLVSELEDRVIDSGIIKNKTTYHYELKFWIDYDADNEAMNKEFNVRLGGEAVQFTKKEVKRLDVSENNDGSVNAVYYNDGTISIQGKGRIGSGLRETLLCDEATYVKYQKQIITDAGYDASSLNTKEEIENFINNTSSSDDTFQEKYDNAVMNIMFSVYKEVFTEFGYDVSNITTIEELQQFMIDNNIIDENGDVSNPEMQKEIMRRLDMIAYGKVYSEDKIRIEKGITNIPSGLFEEIEEITLPSTITSIDDKAFSSTSLKKIKLNYGLKTIGNGAFRSTALTEIDIPKTVTTIGSGAFGSTALTEIDIPKTVTTIGSGAFMNCSSLTKITLYEGLERIEHSVFYGTTSVSEITIPSTVSYVGNYAFRLWTSSQIINVNNTEDYVNSNWATSPKWNYGATVNYLK